MPNRHYLSWFNSDMGSGWAVKVHLEAGMTGDAPGLPTYTMVDEGVLYHRGGPALGIPENAQLLRYRMDGYGVPDNGAVAAFRLVVSHARRLWPGIRTKEAEPRPYRPEDRPNPPPNAMWVDDVARVAGVQPSTIRSYAARGQMPAPEMRDRHGHPWWHPAVVEAWLAGRFRKGNGHLAPPSAVGTEVAGGPSHPNG